jgi:hypothetical protein
LPRRDALRKWAGEKEKAAESVKKSAQKRTGDSDNVCEVLGEVVHVLLKDENKAKVNSGY